MRGEKDGGLHPPYACWMFRSHGVLLIVSGEGALADACPEMFQPILRSSPRRIIVPEY